MKKCLVDFIIIFGGLGLVLSLVGGVILAIDVVMWIGIAMYSTLAILAVASFITKRSKENCK